MPKPFDMLILPGICLLLLLLFASLAIRKKRCRKDCTIHATIRSKALVSCTIAECGGARAGLVYQISFSLADGRLVELSAPLEIGGYPDGTGGTLTFRERKCEAFTPDGQPSILNK